MDTTEGHANLRFQFKVLDGGEEPKRGKPSDVGWDLRARAIVDPLGGFGNDGRRCTAVDLSTPLDKRPTYILHPDSKSVAVGLGIAVSIPAGYAGFVKPRGGAVRFRQDGKIIRLMIANEGVPIDPGFTGEIWAEVVNVGENPFRIKYGSRFCQLVVVSALVGEAEIVSEFSGLKEFLNLRGRRANGSSGTIDPPVPSL